MSKMNDELKVVIIAGPNGAGKTTFAREFLGSLRQLRQRPATD